MKNKYSTYIKQKTLILAPWSPCLEKGIDKIPKMYPYLYSVPMINGLKFQMDRSTRTSDP